MRYTMVVAICAMALMFTFADDTGLAPEAQAQTRKQCTSSCLAQYSSCFDRLAAVGTGLLKSQQFCSAQYRACVDQC